MQWRTHDGSGKPAELSPNEETGEPGLEFCPRIRIVDRDHALKGGFTNSPQWKWSWMASKPGPGDILEYAVK